MKSECNIAELEKKIENLEKERKNIEVKITEITEVNFFEINFYLILKS